MTISKREFARRRRRLMDEMEAGGIAIVPSSSLMIRNRDVEHPFRQDSDFYYLTGFDEPDAVLVLAPGRKHGELILFCQDKDEALELWTGYRAGPEGVCTNYGVDDAFPVTDIDDILPGLLEGRSRVYYAMGRNSRFDHQLMSWVNSLRSHAASGTQPLGELLDLNHLLHEMRLIKSSAEIKLMQKAADISVQAHRRAMLSCKPGQMEYQLEAELRHEFLVSGARLPAYDSIVGGGDNGCILHYTANKDVLKKDTLVLIDAACEYEYYASDITRTFPVSGKFTTEQRALYDVVLASQLAAIEATVVGGHWNEPHEACVRILTQGLKDLGLLKGTLSSLLKKEAYKPFYMHRTGHWLGMDVHDVGDYRVGGEWRLLEVGMVLTVEPGLYISPTNTKVAKKWRGIGIRIEDDVLVSKDGPQVLTAALPKTAEDIERLMAGIEPNSKPRSVNVIKKRKAVTVQAKKSVKQGVKKKTVKTKTRKKKAM